MSKNDHTYKKPWTREAGYTLTELLIVLMLLSLMMSVSGPALQKIFPSIAVNSSADRLEADLRRGKRHAVLRSQIIELKVSSNNRSYWLNAPDGVLLRRALPRGVLLKYNGSIQDEIDSAPEFRILPNGQIEGQSLFISGHSSSREITPNLGDRHFKDTSND